MSSLIHSHTEHPFQIQSRHFLPVDLHMDSRIIKNAEEQYSVPVRRDRAGALFQPEFISGQFLINTVKLRLSAGSEQGLRNGILSHCYPHASVLIRISEVKEIIIPVTVLLETPFS